MFGYYTGRTIISNKILLYIDGSCRGNPGPGGIGVVFFSNEGSILEERSIYIGEVTNNIAEYKALLFGLRLALMRGYLRLEVFSDSELLVRQINGEYKVKNKLLKELNQEAKILIEDFEEFGISYISREKNHLANKLANKASFNPSAEGGI